jgi:CO/xanthine dehydrogenase Mo-binding subunit
MSQTPQKPKIKIEPKMESVIQIHMPMVRDYSTGGGHGPESVLIEGDQKIQTKKWQGYAPQNLNILGKPMPPIADVAIPRYTGKAMYASRVMLPNMLFLKILTSPHPRARIRSIDTSEAEKMPGVAYVMTYKNAPKTNPLPEEPGFFGEIVALVAAETEDLAEDALDGIKVDYEVLPAVSTVAQAMSPNAPDLRKGKGNLILINADNGHTAKDATWVAQRGDVDKGFAEADVVKEFSYYFAGATAVPIQPAGSVAKWDGDKLTFWGMGQGIAPDRDGLARGLGIDPKNVHYINKWNGCTFGAARAQKVWRINVLVAAIAKATGRAVKLMMTKDQELAHINIKPEILAKFKVGAKKDGHIVALTHEVYISGGDIEGGGHATAEISKNQMELYTTKIPHWKARWFNYRTNVIAAGSVRSHTQQEVKWGWENMMDDLADALNIDPIQLRLLHISRPGTKINADWHEDFGKRYETVNGELTYDSFASVEVLEEGSKAIEWSRRNPKAGGNPGRFKRGVGMAMSQHHPGHMGYHDQEVFYEKMTADRPGAGGGFGGEVEITPEGKALMKSNLPDSGSNHDTALCAVVGEILGYTSRDSVKVIWGDSEIAPDSGQWAGGHTITLQGAANFSAADKVRKDLLRRASALLKVDASNLQIRDGVISSTEDPKKRTTFAELVRLNKGPIRAQGRGGNMDQGRAMTKGVGATFIEVEVDTWTGDWKFIRTVYSHDVGFVINPLVGEADMHGSLVQSFQMATETLPWDREFPGTRHYSVGYLSYRLPTIMDVPENQTQIFIDSLEPRWFYGTKSFSETSIGSVPGAISNAIYNACGVRIREHPITREKIIAGLRAKGGRT